MPEVESDTAEIRRVACLTLLRGSSQTQSIVLTSSSRVQQLVVGSSSRCDWRIAAVGVRARHFRLTWVQDRLRVQDVCEPGAVRIEGRPIGDRLDLPVSAHLEFGGALIAVDVIRTAGRAGAEDVDDDEPTQVLVRAPSQDVTPAVPVLVRGAGEVTP